MITHDLPALRLTSYESHEFVSTGTARTPAPPARDRNAHAARLLEQLDLVDAQLAVRQQEQADNFEGSLLEIRGSTLSDVSQSLGDSRTGVEVLLAGEHDRAVIRVPGGIGALRKKIESYATEQTETGKPKNQALVARIEAIELATLTALSMGEISEGDVAPNATYLVEIWLPKQAGRGTVPMARLAQFVGRGPSTILESYAAIDRDIALVQMTGQQLLTLPSELPFIAELHRPSKVDLIDAAETEDEGGSILPLGELSLNAPAVAIHDVGIARGNPYLDGVLLAMESAVPGEGPEPNPAHHPTHGAEMAGLAVYGDLATHVESGVLQPTAYLVSVKLLGADLEPLWPERTRLAVELAEFAAGDRPIVHNLSMGAPNETPGQRTIWSVALDELAWNGGQGRLIVVAAGNVDDGITDRDDYPDLQFGSEHVQPAQAWNAITVGGVTELDQLGPEDIRFGSPPPLAPKGHLSPHSAIGPGGKRPVKPDLSNEAGNTAPGGGLPNVGLQGLSLLTTGLPQYQHGRLLSRVWATSAAAALTTNALASLSGTYPHFRPATIRALLAHSVDPTHSSNTQFTDKSLRHRAVGFGVPNLRRASTSSSNRPVMVFEGELSPRRHAGSGRLADREAVFIRLPLPEDILREVEDVDVRLSITLSYFIEPTASLVRRDYAGARLHWDIQGPLESESSFESRINLLMAEQGIPRGQGSYPWEHGEVERSRGTLQHDTTVMSVSELQGTRMVGIYPVLGWWEQRSEFHQQVLPFSLVASVDLGNVDVDLYTPISVELSVPVEIPLSQDEN